MSRPGAPATGSGPPEACQVVSRQVLYSVPDRMGGWPSVVHSGGELVAVFSGDRRQHVDPYGKTLLVRSADDGVTWSPPHTANDTLLDDRDAGLVETPRGTWVLTFFTSHAFATWEARAREHYGDAEVDAWGPYIERLTPEALSTGLGSFVRTSTDRGRTWAPSVRVPVSAPHGPAVTADGPLLYLGTHMGEGPAEIGLCQSEDDGATWSWHASVCPSNAIPGTYLCEPHLAELPDGRLVGMLRANADREADRVLYQVESADGGSTWSSPRNTGLWGLPPHLLLHSSGVLVCSYGHRRKPFGQRAALSTDGGATWERVLSVAEVDHGAWQSASDVGPTERPGKRLYYQEPDLGYPCTTELPDGSLYTVYYESFPDRAGAAILGVRWRLPGLKSPKPKTHNRNSKPKENTHD